METPRPAPEILRSFALPTILPADARLWGVFAEADELHHEAALFQLGSGGRYILVLLTDRQVEGRSLCNFVVRAVLDAIRTRNVPVPRPVPS